MNFKKGDIVELEIHDFAYGGKGIHRMETEQGRYVVFVLNAIPGQIVKAKIQKKRKKFAEGRLIEVIKRSELEEVSPYQAISGAPYITLPIEKQREFKEAAVIDLFRKIANIEDPKAIFDEFISSPNSFHYRNKMEYSFSVIRHDLKTGEEMDDFGLGFKRTGTWWKVENLDRDSGMFDQQLEDGLHKIRIWLEKTGLPAWHPPKKEGFYRHFVVRKSFSNDELLINLVTSSNGLDQFDKEAFKDHLIEVLGNRLAGFIHTVNDDVADRAKLENGPSGLVWGNEVISENILGLDFEISMQSFFQTNPKSAERLYTKVVEYASEDNELNGSVIMDLFCGTGTIGQIIASKTDGVKIIGVDIVESAIENAKKNSDRNGVTGVEWYAADVGKFLLEYPEYENKIDTIILDPPRAGIAPKTLRKVMRLGAKRIVYVSCNPATQARDIAELTANGFKIKKFSLVDQFPHTGHIESIALFEKT
ncbi:MAG: 23S rRNA (uracil(1939)-C(5))-methyltransferase RlmD [Flavobacteriales bacterium]|nr:23S rRNA (uracil(1939)-C(5))-methyltransferase RlmD [Flavobacteriales bacterium]